MRTGLTLNTLLLLAEVAVEIRLEVEVLEVEREDTVRLWSEKIQAAEQLLKPFIK
jgi:hypothetical protein